MLRANRRAMLVTGNAVKAKSRGLDYRRTRRRSNSIGDVNGGERHGGTRPRMGAQDLWDVVCWCGWTSTGHEARVTAVDAAVEHWSEVRPRSAARVSRSTTRTPGNSDGRTPKP